jgi:aminoglycoside phosphotransferase family enzyme/predicted kinase
MRKKQFLLGWCVPLACLGEGPVGTRTQVNNPVASQLPLIEALQNPSLYDHTVANLQLIETHISWVILTGDYVYKIKKAVDFGFLDYSTLEKRAFFCREELRLNQRFAPQIYLDVIEITGTGTQPVLQGSGEPVEYAVRMKQFSQAGLLSTLAAQHQLTRAHVNELAVLLPGMHERVAVADVNSEHGLPADIRYWVVENFEHIRPVLEKPQQQQQLDAIERWCRQTHDHLQLMLTERRREGFVRECHGDLHLGNLAIIDGCITAFDGIEFNEQLRWIDVMSELAFLVMDVRDRGYPRYAWSLLNGYLQRTGDYAGLAVLRYYLVYRALVRAKVAVLRLAQVRSTLDRQDAWFEYASYMRLADEEVHAPLPSLIITHGVSGSGKSFYAARLAEQFGAVRIRSDIERKRLFGFAADDATHSAISAGIYSEDASSQTYERLAELARTVIQAGYTVIVDATFLEFERRVQFRRLADDLSVPFLLLHCHADRDTLQARIHARQAAGDDPSEAGIAVLKTQLAGYQPLRPEELGSTLDVDASGDADDRVITGLIAVVRERLVSVPDS